MELREALEVLGVERVRKGMRAIDGKMGAVFGAADPASCFVAEAFGGECRYSHAKEKMGEVSDAAALVEAFYEGYLHLSDRHGYPQEDPDVDFLTQAREFRATLRETCITFLAEHGSAIEPSPMESETSVRG